jgi:hypothetical protein
MDTDSLQAKMRTYSAPLGCSRKLTRRQRIACDEPGSTLATLNRNPNAYTQPPRPNTEPLRYAEKSQGRRNRRKRKRVARQQQPRRTRRIQQHLAAQHSIGDRSLQHALFAINRAPRGVIFVTTLAVPFDNSVLRMHVLIPQSPPQLPHCASVTNLDSSVFACFAIQPVVVFRRYRATC